MREVNIERKKLLEIIKTNRTVHLEEYEASLAAYRIAAIKLMKANLKQAEKGGEIEQFVNCVKPNSMEETYNTAISMLELSEDDLISLTLQEFSQYVEDKWGWRGQFDAVASSYGVGGSKGPRGSAGLSGALGGF